MAFKKDGEIKIFMKKKLGSKSDSDETLVRYTVDDLIKDSEVTTKKDPKEEKEDVSN